MLHSRTELGVRLAGRKDHFAKTGAQLAVRVEREAAKKILKRRKAALIEGGIGRGSALGDITQDPEECFFVHGECIARSRRIVIKKTFLPSKSDAYLTPPWNIKNFGVRIKKQA